MGLKLAAASGGSIELNPANTASNFTVTVPASTGTMLTNTTQLVGTGTTTTDSASTGYVGEYVSSQVTAGVTGLTSTVAYNATSISLTAGDWDVSGAIFVNQGSGTTLSLVQASINTTSATNQGATTGYCTYLNATFATSSGLGAPVPTLRLSLSATTTVYLVVAATFAVSTAGAGGFLRARRVR